MPSSVVLGSVILPHERGTTLYDLVAMLIVIERLQHAYEQLPTAAMQQAQAEDTLEHLAMEQRLIVQRIETAEQRYEACDQAEQRLRLAYQQIAQNIGGISYDLVYPDLDASRIAIHLSDSAIDKRIAELEALISAHETKSTEAERMLASPLSTFQALGIITQWKQIIRTSQDKINRYHAELDKLAYTKRLLPLILERIAHDREELLRQKRETESELYQLYHQPELEQRFRNARRLAEDARAHDGFIRSYRRHYPHLLPPATESRPTQWLWEKGVALRTDFLQTNRHHTNDDINQLLETRTA